MNITLAEQPRLHNLDYTTAFHMMHHAFGTAIRRAAWPKDTFITLVNNKPPFSFCGNLRPDLLPAKFDRSTYSGCASSSWKEAPEDIITQDWLLYDTTSTLSEDDITNMILRSPLAT